MPGGSGGAVLVRRTDGTRIDVSLLALLVALDFGRYARQQCLSYRELTGGTLLVIAMLTALVAAVAMGSIGQRIMTSLAWDDSAQVRTQSVMIFTLLDWQQLLFGMSPDAITAVAWEVGIRKPDAAIESFWLALALQVGVPLLALFAPCLLAFLARLARFGGAASALGLIGFLVVVSTSISLAIKSELLVAVVALAQLAGAYRCTGLLRQAGRPDRPRHETGTAACPRGTRVRARTCPVPVGPRPRNQPLRT